MTHNKNLVFDCHKLSKSLCFYSRFYACILCCLFTLATKISNSSAILNNSLIATSCKCQINGNTGVVVTLSIRLTAETKTDTKSGRNRISDINSLNIFKERKFIFLKLFELMLLKRNKILIIFHLANNTVYFRNILVNLSVYKSHKKRLAYIFYTINQFIIIINVNQSGNHPLFFILTDIFVKLRDILKINSNKRLLLPGKFHKLL